MTWNKHEAAAASAMVTRKEGMWWVLIESLSMPAATTDETTSLALSLALTLLDQLFFILLDY
jgi:hypothetical protein